MLLSPSFPQLLVFLSVSPSVTTPVHRFPQRPFLYLTSHTNPDHILVQFFFNFRLHSLMAANVPSATQRWEVFQFHPSSSPPPLTPVAGGSTAALEASRSEDQQLQQWSNSDSSVNAVSFGFVATAILVSMFLVMAIFERFLRSNSPTSPSHPPQPGSAAAGRHGDLESGQGFRRHLDFNPKLGSLSPEMTVYSKGVSVLMPGEEVPTFIAYPAPVPCPPDRIHWPIQQHNLHSYPTPPNLNRDPSYSNRGSSSF